MRPWMKSGRGRWSAWMPDYRLLVFDWDGTLVDSIARIVRTVQQAAAGLGLPPRSDEAVRGIIGLALP
ncbi:TPA: HAD hydrolase-like protein, partial [Klebsiella pneumoniae]